MCDYGLFSSWSNFHYQEEHKFVTYDFEYKKLFSRVLIVKFDPIIGTVPLIGSVSRHFQFNFDHFSFGKREYLRLLSSLPL